MLAATQTAPAAPAAAAPPAEAKPQVYIPQTWGEVFDSQKAFVAAATPVMAVFFGVLSAVVTAAKCPGMRQAAAPAMERSYAKLLIKRGDEAASAGYCESAEGNHARVARARVPGLGPRMASLAKRIRICKRDRHRS